jgi:hypothetical protein
MYTWLLNKFDTLCEVSFANETDNGFEAFGRTLPVT